MYVVCVTVYVKHGHEDDFIKATKANHKGTRQESGNVRFDVLQAADDPARFFLYEVYEDKESFSEHQKTKHYLKWRETVADWMDKPREGVKYKNIFPSDDQF